MHAALRIALGHFLVENAAARRHPLHVTRGHLALVAQAVAMLDRAGEHVGDGLDAAMRMPGKSRQIILRIFIAEIVQQQEGIEILRFAETEGALQLYAGALNSGLRLNDLLYRTERHKFLFSALPERTVF